MKSLGSGRETSDAVSELYDEKRPHSIMTCPEWSQFNKDLWAALVHLSHQEKQRRKWIIADRERGS